MPDLVHIEIRREAGIGLDDWRAVVSSKSDMRLVHTLPGCHPRTRGPLEGLAPDTGEWTGHPDGVPYRFEFLGDHIEVQWADAHCEDKARELAVALDARVCVRSGD